MSAVFGARSLTAHEGPSLHGRITSQFVTLRGCHGPKPYAHRRCGLRAAATPSDAPDAATAAQPRGRGGGGGRGGSRDSERGGRGGARGGDRSEYGSGRGGRSGSRGDGRSASRRVDSATPPAPAPAPDASVLRIFGVNVPVEEDPGKDDFSVHPALLAALSRRLRVRAPAALDASSVSVVRKSFDARRAGSGSSGTSGGKGHPSKHWVYVVDVPEAAARAGGARRLAPAAGQLERLPASAPPALLGPDGSELLTATGSSAAHGDKRARSAGARGGSQERVVVVGSGPAGLFAALALAEAGVKVVLLERGRPVEARGADIGALFVRRRLNPESNLCYGEGGAGTWSDGKLTTRIGRNSDPVRVVLRAFHAFGAPPEVLVSGKPHLGTDRLVRMLRAFRGRLLQLGVDVRFEARVDDLLVVGGRATGVRLADGSEVLGRGVVLAVGHSARDVYARLAARGVALSPKPFALGFRIEHPQALVDRLQYGAEAAGEVLRGRGRLPVAEYRLATEIAPARGDDWYAPQYGVADAAAAGDRGGAAEEGKAGKRGVYSFCMCPGGQIVPTSTDPQLLCINGMSFSRRNSVWANSALVATVAAPDWAHHVPAEGPLAGVALQAEYEREAAARGGGGLVAPVQRAADFLEGRISTGDLPTSSYRLGVHAAPLHDLYPPHLTAAFRQALLRFERSMPGFATSPDALLHAAETRTSAPVRVDRGPGLESVSLPGLYPCGEGAGYAGGIVSAAVDGLRVGQALVAELTGAELPADGAADFKGTASWY